MDLQIYPVERLEGVVNAPPSKSYTHRAIILAGLSRGMVRIYNPLLSADPMATIDAMRAAGARIETTRQNSLRIHGNAGQIEAPELVDVRNSGTTIRIMTSVFSLCNRKVILTGDESIQKRPMGPLLEALEEVGVETTSHNGMPPISVKGPIKGNRIRIRGDVSSQYISGLLMACPLRECDTTVEITTGLRSRPYLDLTLDIIHDFDVVIENKGYRQFLISGGQSYSRGQYFVEGDYSGAAFILAAAAITDSDVTVKNLYRDSKQGDKYFLEILQRMGADVKISRDNITVRGGQPLRGVDVDLSQTPDILPVMAVICASANGRSIIRNVEHARIKECDRISAMAQGLRKMGVKLEEKQDGLVIEGPARLRGADICGFGDHRIVMALSVAGLKADGPTRITDAETIGISYPGFLDALKLLGIQYNISP